MGKLKSSFISNDRPDSKMDSENVSNLDSDNGSSFFDPPIENYGVQY